MELKHNYKPYSRIKNTTKIKFRSHKPVIKQKIMEIIVLQKWISPHKTYYWKLNYRAHAHLPYNLQNLPYNIYDKKRAKETLHYIYMYIVTRNQKIQCKTYTVEYIMYKIYHQIKSRFIFPKNQKSLYAIT